MKIVSLSILPALMLMLTIVAMSHADATSSNSAHESSASAAELYARNCVKCHGKDGRAKGIKGRFSGARNLSDPEWQDRVSDERIYNVISNGKGRMPAFAKKLTDAEIDSLVQYVRDLKK